MPVLSHLIGAETPPCGDDPGAVCEWVLDHTGGNETAATAADWLIGKPLAIAGVLIVSWIVHLLARRFIRRAVRRMLIPPQSVMKQLDALGVSSGDETEQVRRAARANSIGAALASAVSAVIASVAVVTIASILGFQLGPIIAGAGVMGVAIGFGAQSLVRDAINGVFMLIEDQYGIGDTVDLGAASGVVERISLRTTVLRGGDGTIWHVPNGQVMRVGNQSQRWSVAVVDVVVAYTTDITVARMQMHGAAEEVCGRDEWKDDVLEAPEVLGVESLTATGVTLRLLVRTNPGRQFALQRALREAIKDVFETSGIEMPFPDRTTWTRVDGAQ